MRVTTFTVVIPTIGRASLAKTLDSIPSYVEKIVVADTHAPLLTNVAQVCKDHGATYYELNVGKRDRGSAQIDYGMKRASGEYLLNFGDDDVYEPYAFQIIENAIKQENYVAPLMFRVALHPVAHRGNTNIAVLWQYKKLDDKYITGQCFVVPNISDRLGTWFSNADVDFIKTTVSNYDHTLHWRPEIIAQCY
jgi:glycosyltransferase involved in cell wall biosynthesis